MKKIPAGIYYEAARSRWRVRLYKNRNIVHQSYHKNFRPAFAAWVEAKARQQRAHPRQIDCHTQQTNDLLNTIYAAAHPLAYT